MVLKKGVNTGDINVNVFGSYYGSPDRYEAIMKPFLDAMVCTMRCPWPVFRDRYTAFQPAQMVPAQVNVTSWLWNLELLGNGSIVSTPESTAAEHNTFYTKSLTTPSDVPMPDEAIAAFVRWLSVEGWYTDTVRDPSVPSA